MAMSATSMANRIIQAMQGVEAQQVVGSGNIDGYRQDLIVAMCQGIIAEIQADAVVTCENPVFTTGTIE